MRTWNKLLKFAGAMKCYTQVYVINSMEAAETYCRAFGAKVTYGIKNDAQTAYEHCELSANNESIPAVAEASEFYDVSMIHRTKRQTMTFSLSREVQRRLRMRMMY